MGAAECTATIAVKATTFTYDELTEPDLARPRRAATELRAKLRRTVAEVVASGRLLADARQRLGFLPVGARQVGDTAGRRGEEEGSQTG